MAIATPVLVQSWFDNVNHQGGSFHTNQADSAGVTEGNAAVALVAGRHYYAFFAAHASTLGTLTSLVFDSGGPDQVSFTKVTGAGVQYDTTKDVEVWELECVASTGASAFQPTFSVTPSARIFILCYVTGHDTSGTNVQVPTATGTSAAPAVTFAAFGATDNLTLFFPAFSTSTGSFTATEGRTELADRNDNERQTLGVFYQNPHGSDTSVGATASASDTWAAIGIEVKAAAGGATQPPRTMHQARLRRAD